MIIITRKIYYPDPRGGGDICKEINKCFDDNDYQGVETYLNEDQYNIKSYYHHNPEDVYIEQTVKKL